MKKLLVVMGVFAGVAALARRFASHLGSIDWEKKFDSMPDNAPPKWCFNNMRAIRENTERIIDLLEPRSASGAREPVDSSTS